MAMYILRPPHRHQPKKPCKLIIHELTYLEKMLDCQKFAMETFIDIEGVFDNTSF